MKKIFSLVLITIVIIACSSDDNSSGGDGGTNTDDFNRKTMLENFADNIIIPALQDLTTKINNLETNSQTFTATPNQANLDALRSAWFNAYKNWQYVEMFNIGKAEEIGYYFLMNTYPTNTSDIENNVLTETYDLASPNNHDAQGFPALDYLLYGVASGDAAIINKYSSDANASKYKAYLIALITQMKSATAQVLNDWNGTYRDTFVNSDQNTATSSVNKLVNDFVFYYEKGFRANKIGIPAGNFSATPLPDRVEAFYREDASKELAMEAMVAIQNFFNGKHYNTSATGQSFKTYLDYLNTIKNGADLSTLITNQLNEARSRINALDSNFVIQINSDNTKMTEAYDAIQLAVVLMKVDMLQAFNVTVDYVDADGD